MRRPGTVLGVLILCASGIGSGLAAVHLSGEQAPDFVLKSIAGENIRLSEHRGEVVMLSFWAKWCDENPERPVTGHQEPAGTERPDGIE